MNYHMAQRFQEGPVCKGGLIFWSGSGCQIPCHNHAGFVVAVVRAIEAARIHNDDICTGVDHFVRLQVSATVGVYCCC